MTKFKLKDKQKIYFDNNIVSLLLGIENPEYIHTIKTIDQKERSAIHKIWDLYKCGEIIIVTSAETRRELERHPEQYKNQEVIRLEYYTEIKKIPVTSGVIYGQYKYGEGKYGVSPIKEKVASIIPKHKGKELDVKHIVNFIDDSTCQFFVTLDKHLLRVRNILFNEFNVRIDKPSVILRKMAIC